MMIYLGRPGLHSDWVRFQVEARKNRQDAEKERVRKIEELKEGAMLLGAIIGGAIVVLGGAFIIIKAMGWR